jgi:hypothetical protein
MSSAPSLSGEIEARIAEYLADDDPRLEWTKAKVREHDFLPLYLGWVAALGIRPDQSFVRWDYEITPERVGPLLEPFLQRLAICEGARKYPELGALLPERPAMALTCQGLCRGSGGRISMPGGTEVICECGGTGWVIPGETLGEATG